MIGGRSRKVPMSMVTAAVVPEVRVTVSGWLSRLPAGIVMVVAPPLRLPFGNGERQDDLKRRTGRCHGFDLIRANLF